MSTEPTYQAAAEIPPMSELLPGGYTRSALVVGQRSPRIASGIGCKVFDQAGRELIDMNNDFSALINGNAHPELVAEVRDALEGGSAFGAPTEWEGHHAEILLKRLETCDQVRYTTSGSEAVMTAVRLARDFTGREKIIAIRNAYHGFADSVIGAGGSNAQRGIPRGLLEQLVLIDHDDIAALTRSFERNPSGIAAVLLDLMPNRAGLIELSDDFIATARRLCDESGALLIDDEVINFRDGVNGVAANRGLKPDLVVLGKMIGGGQPAGAVAGPAEIMEHFDPFSPVGGLEHGGTFAATPQMLRAGARCLQLFDDEAAATLNELGALARERLGIAIEPHGWEVRGRGSLLRPFPRGASGSEAKERQRQLFWAAYEAGVLVMPTGLMALSTPMTEEIVKEAVDRVALSIAGLELEGEGV